VVVSPMSAPTPSGGRRGASPKRRGSPGPGAYDPKPVSALGQSHRKGQTSSFKSTSKRGIEKELTAKGEGGDPGKYNPHMSFTDPGKKSFGWEASLSPSMLEKQKNGKGKKGKQGTFGGGTAKRELGIEIAGEGSPGPGSYLPASTFGAYSKSSNSSLKQQSSSFKSGAAQRPRPINEHVPGAGAYTPNLNAVEKNRINSANGLKSKGIRFGTSSSATLESTDDDIGPGAYESHVHNSVAKAVAKNVEQMSRQNPGFGIAGPAHELPHEQAVEDDQDLPGPGHFEQKPGSKLENVNGHNSVFKLPTKRTKGPPDADFGSGPTGGRSGGRGKSGGGKKDGAATVHV